VTVRTRRRSLVVLLLAMAVGTATGACTTKAPSDPVAVDPAFYETPSPMPEGVPGDVLRAQKVQATGDGTIWRILYRSTALDGGPIAVSGIVTVPPGRAPAGGWPVLSLAHGTTGIADACAPSRGPVGGSAFDVAKQGFVVVATDYEGLGTAGRHPFLVGESEARGVIDAVRAARAMGAEVGAGDRYVVVGYSQGGHAALFANQIAATWAPELHLAGTVAGAPVVELGSWLRGLAQDPALGWLDAFVVAGFGAVDPAARPALVLTPAAVAKLGVVDQRCSTQITGAFTGLDGGVLAHDLTAVAPFAQLVATNTPGQVAGAAPLLVVAGGADELIPTALTDAAVARICGTGQVVVRRSYPGVDHAGIIPASLTDAVTWLQARLAGQPVGSTCG
jgi:alpha-beta hydrolase superfamily lysophospholipase